jgi:parallel beta-helix repeat protein
MAHSPSLTVILSASILSLVAPPLEALAVACGDSISTDTTLTADLSCPEDGLVIAANGITLDLGGHALGGDGIGIVNDGFARVTIRNGAVVRFHRAIELRHADHALLEGLSMTDMSEQGGLAVRVENSRGVRIEGNSIDADDVLLMERCHHCKVIDNYLDAETYGSFPIRLVSSSHNRIVGNDIHGYASLSFVRSHGNLFARNDIWIDDDAGEPSVLLQNSHANSLRDNQVDGQGEALALIDSWFNLVSGNRLASPHSVNPADSALLLLRAHLTWIDRNAIEALGCGILVSGRWNRLRWNQVAPTEVDSDCRDGIRVTAASRDTLVKGNHVQGFEDDGIQVDSPRTALRLNRTDGNGDLGIEAVAGVRDGGGNVAAGNGNPAQCVNVACSAP